MEAAPKIPDAPRGSDHLALDCRGMNFYRIDRGLQDLLELYMDPEAARAYGAALRSAR